MILRSISRFVELGSEIRMGGEADSRQPLTAEGVAVAVNVRCSNGTKFSVTTSLDSTVESFKELIAQNSDVPANQQRLIYKGRILKDDQTLLSYGNFLIISCFISVVPLL